MLFLLTEQNTILLQNATGWLLSDFLCWLKTGLFVDFMRGDLMGAF